MISRSWRRSRRGAVVAIAAAAVALLAPVDAAHSAPGDTPVPPETIVSEKGAGSLSAADRDFVTKVRLAGLWEIPAGNMAQEKSDDPRIRRVGKAISEQHVKLDELTRIAAAKLQIPLPDEPNTDQRAWLSEMQATTSSTDFDQIYISRLRAAHGGIFPAIGYIRAATRNDVVRRLAQQANQFVMTHLTLLESSGLVDYGALPAAPQPKAANAVPSVDQQMLVAASGSNGVPGVNTSAILVVLAAALIAGTISTMRILRSR